jgi:hypothetical protein
MFTYEIDEDNAIHVFDSNGVKILFQPNYPDFTPFTLEQATVWAEQFVLFMSDETADMPGDNPEMLTKPRPSLEIPEQI